MKTIILIFSLLILSTISFAQSDWSTSGNNGLNQNINFLGNTDDVDIRFRTNNENRMVLTGDKGWLGHNTMAPTAPVDVFNGNVIFRSALVGSALHAVWPLLPPGTVPVSGIGMRLMWLDSVGAFRAGVNGIAGPAVPYWDAHNIGAGSIGLGVDVGAFDTGSIAIGNQTVARGARSVSIGHESDVTGVDGYSFGITNNVDSSSMAVGFRNEITHDRSFAFGQFNYCHGSETMAFGRNNISSGFKAFSCGVNNVSSGFCSFAFGFSNQCSENFSMALGQSLNNQIASSLMIGMNSPLPSIFCAPASGPTTWGNVGFGNITAPTELIDVNGNARFRDIPSETPNVLITGVEEDVEGDYSLSYLAFSGSSGEYLGGDGTWHPTPPAEQCDWNLNGQNIIMGYPGSIPMAACRSGNVGIGTHNPTQGKVTVMHQNGTGVFSRVTGSTAEITAIIGRTAVGGNNQQSIAVRADNFLTTGCSAEFTESDAYGVRAYANNGNKNFAVYAEAIPHINVDGEIDTCASYESSWAGYFNGATFSPGGIWHASDENLKTEIQPVSNSSDILAELNPASYQFNHTAFQGVHLPAGQHYGIMAQELETLMPSAVTTVIHPAQYDEDGNQTSPSYEFKAVNYTELIPILIAGHKEQQSKIDDLASQVAFLTEPVAACCEAGGAKSMNQPQGPKDEGMNYDLRIEQPYLGQNVPNPFMVETSITYRIPEQAMVRVRVMDAKGQQVDMLVDGLMPKGEYRIVWNASHLPAGLYFYTLEADGVELVKKAVKL